jgi:hypothetical protein
VASAAAESKSESDARVPTKKEEAGCVSICSRVGSVGAPVVNCADAGSECARVCLLALALAFSVNEIHVESNETDAYAS